MVHTATRPGRPTYADVLALPEHVVGEILAGELVVSPRPAPPHAAASSGLGALVWAAYHYGSGGPGGWWILDEPELHLDVDPDFPVVVPDLAGWRRERLPALPDEAYFTMPPDWVCEVLSPRSAPRDRAEKLPFYARAGVAHAWLVDPIGQTLEVYRLAEHGWQVARIWRGDVAVRAEPFDALELALGPLWDTGEVPDGEDPASDG